MIHSSKFQKKYMELAIFWATQADACPARSVAAVIIDDNHKVRGVGYNGPPKATPHCHTFDYLDAVVRPKLTADQKESLVRAFGDVASSLKACADQKVCPRHFLGYKSGERLDLCSCIHAEENAIINAAQDVSGCAAYITCAPCFACAGKLINAKIVEVHYPRGFTYSDDTRWLLEKAQILQVEH